MGFKQVSISTEKVVSLEDVATRDYRQGYVDGRWKYTTAEYSATRSHNYRRGHEDGRVAAENATKNDRVLPTATTYIPA